MLPIRTRIIAARDGAIAMRNFGIRQIQSTARIVLICPDCGHENSEFADTLRGMSTYYCNGEDCDYIFGLAPRRRMDVGQGFVDACKRFYAAVATLGGQRVR
jgi:hypothetical protein